MGRASRGKRERMAFKQSELYNALHLQWLRRAYYDLGRQMDNLLSPKYPAEPETYYDVAPAATLERMAAAVPAAFSQSEAYHADLRPQTGSSMFAGFRKRLALSAEAVLLLVTLACGSGSVPPPPQPTPSSQQTPQIAFTAPAPTPEAAAPTPALVIPAPSPAVQSPVPTPAAVPDAVPFPVPLPLPTPVQAPVPTPAPTLSPTPPATPKLTPVPVPTVAPLDVPRPDVAPYTPKGSSGPIRVGTPRQLGVNPAFAGDERLYVVYGVQNLARRGSPVPSYPAEFYGSAFVADLELRIDGHVADKRSFSLAPGGNIAFSTPLEDVVRKVLNEEGVFLAGGLHKFELVLGTANADFPPLAEQNTANNKASVNMPFQLAKPPVPMRQPQSEIERMIQDNAYTWFGKGEEAVPFAIIKGIVQKETALNWINFAKIQFGILPYDEFNKAYAAASGQTPKNRLRAYALATGTTTSQQISSREAPLVPLLLGGFREVGGAGHVMANNPGASKMLRLNRIENPFELSLAVFETYARKKLEEDYGLAGLVNISYLVNASTLYGNIMSSVVGLELRSLWAIAIDGGYPDGNAPSSFWFAEYNKIIQMSDPTSYIIPVGKKANALDTNRIKRILNERLVDKAPTPLPEDVRQKLDPNGTYGNSLSQDDLLTHEQQFAAP